MRDIIDHPQVQALVELALSEDIGSGDVTSEALFAPSDVMSVQMCARQELVVCGLPLAEYVLRQLDEHAEVELLEDEGALVEAGAPLMKIHAATIPLLGAERTMLNFVQRMSGVALLTKRFVDEIAGTGSMLLDTRKTIPGWRVLDKYATKRGGAENHRMGLYDRVMMKDNHIAAAGGLPEAIAKARAAVTKDVLVEVECDTLVQVREALSAKPDWILLDNMTPKQIAEAVQLERGAVKFEASGGITLENIRSYAEAGVDAISVGALTHSAVAVDVGLDA